MPCSTTALTRDPSMCPRRPDLDQHIQLHRAPLPLLLAPVLVDGSTTLCELTAVDPSDCREAGTICEAKPAVMPSCSRRQTNSSKPLVRVGSNLATFSHAFRLSTPQRNVFQSLTHGSNIVDSLGSSFSMFYNPPFCFSSAWLLRFCTVMCRSWHKSCTRCTPFLIIQYSQEEFRWNLVIYVR